MLRARIGRFFLGPIVYSSYFSVIFSHDNLYWFLPFYKILYSGISTGVLPTWNPYSHGGEPTLVPLLHMHLLDLLSLVTAYIGNLFDQNYIQMAFVDRQVRMLVCGLGISVFLCQWTSSRVIRLFILFTVLYSPLITNGWHQNGIIDHLYLVGWLMFFLTRLLFRGEFTWGNWLGASICYGQSLQSYFFFGPTIVVLLFLLFGLYLNWTSIKKEIRDRWHLPKALTALLIVVVSGILNVLTVQEVQDYVIPVRGLTMAVDDPHLLSKASREDVHMTYMEAIQTGARLQLRDLFSIVISPPKIRPGIEVSEAHLFFPVGIVFFSLVGLFTYKAKDRFVWLSLGVIFLLLALGYQGGVYFLFFSVKPILNTFRHTEQLYSYFAVILLLFATFGLNFVWTRLDDLGRICRDKLHSWSEIELTNVRLSQLSYLIIFCATSLGGALVWAEESTAFARPWPIFGMIIIVSLGFIRVIKKPEPLQMGLIILLVMLIAIIDLRGVSSVTTMLFALLLSSYVWLLAPLLVRITSSGGLREVDQLKDRLGWRELWSRAIGLFFYSAYFLTIYVIYGLDDGYNYRPPEVIGVVIALTLAVSFGVNAPGHIRARFYGILASLLFLIQIADRWRVDKGIEPFEHIQEILGVATFDVVGRLTWLVMTVVAIGVATVLVKMFGVRKNRVGNKMNQVGRLKGQHGPAIALIIGASVLLVCVKDWFHAGWLAPLTVGSVSLMGLVLLVIFLWRRDGGEWSHDRGFVRVVDKVINVAALGVILSIIGTYFGILEDPYIKTTSGRIGTGVMVLAGSLFLWESSYRLWIRRAGIKLVSYQPEALSRIVVALILGGSVISLGTNFVWMVRTEIVTTIPEGTKTNFDLDQTPRIWSVGLPLGFGEAYSKMRIQRIRYPEIVAGARTAIDPLVAEKTPAERQSVPEDYTAERFFLLKRYDEIVRSGFSDHVVKSLLGVGLPILQLKEKSLVVDSALEWFGRSSYRELMDARRETVVLEIVDNGLVVQDVLPTCDDSSNNRESLRIGDSQNGEDDEIQIKEFRANYLRADVTSSQPKFLVFNSAYEKYWRAYLDGHYVRPFIGDGFSPAIAIGCGAHNIEFKYQPTLLLVALGLFNAIPLAGVIFLLFVSIRKANYNGWSKTTTTRI